MKATPKFPSKTAERNAQKSAEFCATCSQHPLLEERIEQVRLRLPSLNRGVWTRVAIAILYNETMFGFAPEDARQYYEKRIHSDELDLLTFSDGCSGLTDNNFCYSLPYFRWSDYFTVPETIMIISGSLQVPEITGILNGGLNLFTKYPLFPAPITHIPDESAGNEYIGPRSVFKIAFSTPAIRKEVTTQYGEAKDYSWRTPPFKCKYGPLRIGNTNYMIPLISKLSLQWFLQKSPDFGLATLIADKQVELPQPIKTPFSKYLDAKSKAANPQPENSWDSRND